ncbi:MAG: sigma-54-dependent Fis family transcriptional regulator [Acidobacteria bacterium]|nr:sigma-54-dependent Fis family transcriptional regulator [Acidobacteriota bacterium]MCB9398247.1 sigma-54-dependent Fis family transcriptional regulator [Acidobacteriota bacterium]
MSGILIVEDRAPLRQLYTKFLQQLGHSVYDCESAEQGLALLKQYDIQLILADYMLPGMDGLQFLARVKATEPDALLVLMTAFGEVKTAVQAMKLGAFDFLEKPIDLDYLKLVVQKALNLRSLQLSQQRMQSQDKPKQLIGQAKSLEATLQLADKVAPTKTHGLILGESGTGKELLARRIHDHSPRNEKPFIGLNCASIPAELLESELFGHEKGAFTGAHARKLGILEMAEHGTLFLDEIGELPMNLQPKLLRVIQENEFRRVGGSQIIKADVRFVFATNRDLSQEVREGRFREDLYYRIAVFPLELPPLRKRLEDIPLLFAHFMAQWGYADSSLDPEVLALLQRYHWPGNVRELENVLERAVILSQGKPIQTNHLPENLLVDQLKIILPLDIQASIRDNLARLEPLVEARLIEWVLRDCQGDKEATAKRLGISLRTLYNRLQGTAHEKSDQE